MPRADPHEVKTLTVCRPALGGPETHSSVEALKIVGTHCEALPIQTSVPPIGKSEPSPKEPLNLSVHCAGPFSVTVTPVRMGVRAWL